MIRPLISNVYNIAMTASLPTQAMWGFSVVLFVGKRCLENWGEICQEYKEFESKLNSVVLEEDRNNRVNNILNKYLKIFLRYFNIIRF